MSAIDSQILVKVPAFATMSAAQRKKLAQAADVREFSPGDIVLWQGQTSQDLWILLEGACEVLKHLPGQQADADPAVLAVLAPYSNFGEMSFFEPQPHSASVRAKTEVKLMRLSRHGFDELAVEDPTLLCKLAASTITSLAERLRHMDDWVVELLTKNSSDHHVPEWTELRRKVFDGWKL